MSVERGLGVVVVLHDINMAARFCDDLLALERAPHDRAAKHRPWTLPVGATLNWWTAMACGLRGLCAWI